MEEWSVLLPPWLIAVLLLFVGAAIGSFLNVVIARLPYEQSIISPRSRCPRCEQPIRWYDNIPILSFVWLKRRCRECHQPISFRYPLVEALTAVMAIALWLKFGLNLHALIYFVFVAALIAISFIDLDLRIIPNEISLPGIVLGFLCSLLPRGISWQDSLWGILVGGGGLLLVSLMYSWIRGREGLGMGDVKLLAMIGAFLGVQSLLFVLLLASTQGVLMALVLWLLGVELKPPLSESEEEEIVSQPEAEPTEASKTGFLSAAIPFGPFLSIAAIEVLFAIDFLMHFLIGDY